MYYYSPRTDPHNMGAPGQGQSRGCLTLPRTWSSLLKANQTVGKVCAYKTYRDVMVLICCFRFE